MILPSRTSGGHGDGALESLDNSVACSQNYHRLGRHPYCDEEISALPTQTGVSFDGRRIRVR